MRRFLIYNSFIYDESFNFLFFFLFNSWAYYECKIFVFFCECIINVYIGLYNCIYVYMNYHQKFYYTEKFAVCLVFT